MIFRGPLLKVSFFIAGTAVSGGLFLWSLGRADLRLAPVTFFLVWLLFVWLLFSAVYKVLGYFELFRKIIEKGDKPVPLAGRDRITRSINLATGMVENLVSRARVEKEEQYRLIQALVEQAGVGLLVCDQEGRVVLVNRSFLDIVSLEKLNHIDKLVKLQPSFAPYLSATPDHRAGDIRISGTGSLHMVSFRITAILLGRDRFRIISASDISDELAREEMAAWKKMIRVIAHELMNSITPMKTLAFAMHSSFSPEGKNMEAGRVDQELVDNVVDGLDAIRSRSEALMSMVDSFRKLYKIPVPEPEPVELSIFIKRFRLLSETFINDREIVFSVQHPERVVVFTDALLLEQVLTNLIRNAAEALDGVERGYIKLKCYTDEGSLFFEIRDNGKGIPEEYREMIFTPFFTTKDRGSGVGLSVSRLIMQSLGGNLVCCPSPDEGSVFLISLPLK